MGERGLWDLAMEQFRRDGHQLTTVNPESLDCFGGDVAWEGAAGTWIYNFSTGAGWSQMTQADPTGVAAVRIEAGLVAAGAGGDTWDWEAALRLALPDPRPGNHCVLPRTTCMGRRGGPGTWLFNFTTATWTQITGTNPEQMLAWGPNLVWENAALGTWIWDGAAGHRSQLPTPPSIEVLGADLLWSFAGGHLGVEWRRRGRRLDPITGAVPTEIASTGAVK